MRDLAELIGAVTDPDAHIVHTESRQGDIDHSSADDSMVEATLDSKLTVSLREGLAEPI